MRLRISDGQGAAMIPATDKTDGIMKHTVTLLDRIRYTRSCLAYPVLENIIQMIRTGNMPLYDREYGNYTLGQAVEYIRKVCPAYRQAWKERLLPAVAFNGIFTEVDGRHIISYSNLTAMDFDHIATPDEMAHLRNRLIKTPCVLSVFVTPGGCGLKAVVLHDNPDPARHGDLYGQLLDKFHVAGVDAGCKDLARRHYLSYDPYIRTRSDPEPFHYVPTIKPPIQMPPSFGSKTVSDRSIVRIMDSVWMRNHPEYWREGNRACSIFRLACLMCRWGVDENFAAGYFVRGWENATMSGEEILGHVRNAYRAERYNFGIQEFRVHKKQG